MILFAILLLLLSFIFLLTFGIRAYQTGLSDHLLIGIVAAIVGGSIGNLILNIIIR